MDALRTILMTSVFTLALSAGAVVNTKDSAYSDTSTDLVVPGVGYDLRVLRSYNSRSLFSGIFGFGMCSDFETKLEVTPESYYQVTECGGGMQITYTPKKADPDKVEDTIKRILSEVKSRNPNMTEKYLADLKKDLAENTLLRDELGRQLKLKGKVEAGAVFYADGRENETVVFKNNEYVRNLSDGTYQKFNQQGQLVAMYDRNGNFLKLEWQNDMLTSVTDNNGRKLNFKYNPSSKKAIEVVGPNGLKATYAYKGEDLIQVVNAWKNTFKYSYDELHNMTRVEFPDKSYKAMTYNTDRDWITSFRNRKGCMESYSIDPDPEDPTDHYTTNVTKKCGSEVTNQSTFEYWHKKRLNGIGKFLYRIRSEVNGDLTDITFHEVFGKPITLTRNKDTVFYTYYDDGLIRSKKEKIRVLEYEYKNSCRKVSAVDIKYFEEKGKKEKDASAPKNVRTAFNYEEQKCNLISARNSDGMFVKLEYDTRGRIAKIEDQSKKIVTIKYEERFGKPTLVNRPGLGSIKVSYKSDGEINKVESKEGPAVAVQVASIFNTMLDMLAPAQAETNL